MRVFLCIPDLRRDLFREPLVIAGSSKEVAAKLKCQWQTVNNAICNGKTVKGYFIDYLDEEDLYGF